MKTKDYVGLIKNTRDYGKYEILEILEGNKKAKIRFLNTGYECIAGLDSIRRNNNIVDKLVPSICGVGALGYSNMIDHTKLYNSWKTMLHRCYNLNYTDYPNYGGKGVTVCERWKRFDYFVEDAVKLPGYDEMIKHPDIVYHLDKDTLQQGVPINQKIYSPETCIWTSIIENCMQRNIDYLDNSSSQYIGVYMCDGLYNSHIHIEHKDVHIGRFSNELAAANMYNVYSKLYGTGYQNDVPYMNIEECMKYRRAHFPIVKMINIVK